MKTTNFLLSKKLVETRFKPAIANNKKMTKILKRTNKELLTITDKKNLGYIIEHEKDGSSHGNEQVIIHISGNQSEYFAKKILKEIFAVVDGECKKDKKFF